MKPIDKFNNPIYPRVFKKMLDIGNKLIKAGYKESINKCNLFYIKTESGDTFFTDLRGTEWEPIYKNTNPLFYWEICSNKKIHIIRRTIKKEYYRLRKAGISPRLSHYSKYGDDELFCGGIENKLIEDGMCKNCHKDIDEGFFCSEICEKESKVREKQKEYNYYLKIRKGIFCASCKRHPDIIEKGDDVILEQFVYHHKSYSPEVKIFICRKCHAKIHKASNAPKRPKSPWGRKGQLQFKFK